MLIVIMDEIAKKYFHDPEAFGKAMELLMEYDISKENTSNFQEVEFALLAQLDDREDYMLEKAIAYDSERKKVFKNYGDKLR